MAVVDRSAGLATDPATTGRSATPAAALLVPIDLSDESIRAVAPAVRLAERLGAGLRLFSWSYDAGEAAAAERYLEGLAETLPAATVHVAVTEDEGAAVPVTAAADRLGATVCMATEAPGALGWTILGSTAGEVVAASRRPVILVGPHVEAPDGAGAAGAVVAAVDGSPAAEDAAREAGRWADRLAAPLTIVHVAEPPGMDDPADVDARDRAYVAGVAARVGGTAVLLHGDPARAIATYAAHRAALLVMGTHGRTGLARIVLGSVSTHVVRLATCPVLVVPSRHRDP